MKDQLVFMLQLVITGVAVGGVYSLMALGFVLIFKASSVVNFGPGELVLFGAYVAWATILNMKLPLPWRCPDARRWRSCSGSSSSAACSARSSASRSSR